MDIEDIDIRWEGPTVVLTAEDDVLLAWEDDRPVLAFAGVSWR